MTQDFLDKVRKILSGETVIFSVALVPKLETDTVVSEATPTESALFTLHLEQLKYHNDAWLEFDPDLGDADGALTHSMLAYDAAYNLMLLSIAGRGVQWDKYSMRISSEGLICQKTNNDEA